jgi:hypothetical protein
MKVLSIRQPWAWLIVNGHKDIENRNWPTNQRGRILIHASKMMTRDDYDACAIFVAGISSIQIPGYNDLKRGGIVGQANLVDCVSASDSPWFCGEFGFVLQQAKPLPFQPLNGALGFFSAEITEQLKL